MDRKYEKILEKLWCSECHEVFRLISEKEECGEVVEGVLLCANGHRFGIHGGVADFGSQEQESGNAWSEYLKDMDYETMEQQIEQAKPEKEKEQQTMLLEALTELVCKENPETIVDIASGRGMFLDHLIPELADEQLPIATDLSFEILARDRMKFKKKYPGKFVFYMACDATNMPVREGSVAVTTSFFGIANMFGLEEKGVREAARVTTKGGALFNGIMNIKEDSEGYRKLKEFMVEQKMPKAGDIFLEEGAKRIHEKFFDQVEMETIVEDVREPEENVLDLLPYPGEWFAYRIAIGRK
ncbi:Ubiquinone/menaquinone biosynthesis C-methylase UbiE [Lachnospiraceae bacterium XBB1006]|nr:Ubiquinone/menaquinone biosynthesis C-methylase UbiE [Lachnospiraceae bacterium XBB1006]